MHDPSTEPASLFKLALIDLDHEPSPLQAEPTGWAAISLLQKLGSHEVLQLALATCAEANPLSRRVGTAVLGQLGHSKFGFDPVFVEERYQGLTGLLDAEQAGAHDAAVLADACVALGHLHDARAIPAVCALRTHSSAAWCPASAAIPRSRPLTP